MIGVIQLSSVGLKLPLTRRPSDLKSTVLRSRLEGRSFWALREITLRVERGEVVGVVGANGAGKTTLLKTIAGIFRPDTGTVVAKGRTATLLALGAGFQDELTGLENVRFSAALHGYSKSDLDRRLDQIVDFAGLADFINEPVRVYSSGMRVRLGLAVALGMDPDILLIDDIFAVGDEAFQCRSVRRIEELASGDTTVVFVSHDADVIRRFCHRGILMSDGRIVHDGQVGEVLARYQEARQGHWRMGD